MKTDVIIVLGIVVATVVGIAISFFRTKSTTKIDTPQSLEPDFTEMLEKIKHDLEEIKQKLQDQIEE
jgi:uncharacterized membrane-anchored protein YhcB (DUF1043 family)